MKLVRPNPTTALFALGVALAATGAEAASRLDYVSDASTASRAIVVDAREQAACVQRSIRGAHCLPAADFLGPHGRLASFRQIFWLLGTAGLSGKEHVLVAGDDAGQRDFVAGMLYLCGQRKVSILVPALSTGAGLPPERMGPGEPRAMTRQPIYLGTARGEEIVLRSELAAILNAPKAPLLLDGRAEPEFAGKSIHASRGGHVPGARSLPMDVLRRERASGRVELPTGKDLVAYANDAYDSVAYYAMLRAATTAPVRVLIDGWTDWANHPPLPVASATHAVRPRT